jgi:hypothetical protein
MSAGSRQRSASNRSVGDQRRDYLQTPPSSFAGQSNLSVPQGVVLNDIPGYGDANNLLYAPNGTNPAYPTISTSSPHSNSLRPRAQTYADPAVTCNTKRRTGEERREHLGQWLRRTTTMRRMRKGQRKDTCRLHRLPLCRRLAPVVCICLLLHPGRQLAHRNSTQHGCRLLRVNNKPSTGRDSSSHTIINNRTIQVQIASLEHMIPWHTQNICLLHHCKTTSR